MNKFFIFAILGACLTPNACAPVDSVLNYQNDIDENSYHFSYKTEDSERSETGIIGKSNGDNQLIRVDGAYSFIATDGKRYQVEYQADEKGYRTKTKSGDSSSFSQKPPSTQPPPQYRPPPPKPVKPISSAALCSLIGCPG